MKQALLVIDMQHGVFMLKRQVFRKNTLLENVMKTIRLAKEKQIPVIFSLHQNDTFLREGSAGFQLEYPLQAAQEDSVIIKTNPDVFRDTEPLEILRERSISSLIITGIISNGCVRTACLSALNYGFTVTLVKDAHSTFYTNAEKLIGRINMEMQDAGVRIITAEDL
ncbi:MAG TPA: isochorismatase family protein [Candidatus Limiplasma sp.]|nr:isochorismatase family protein [Candidatus Limiplasma sp.]HRX07903.1 isochorismatase family protein [Candidatus Limiplasma sp.]